MLFINKFFDTLKNLDTKIKSIMKKGLLLSFFFCIFSTIILYTYQSLYENPILFHIGLSLFKSSLMFGCTFIMCAIGFDTIKKQIA